MDAETLFIKSLDDLHFSINSSDEYEILRAAGIIRQLFLDGAASLVDQVNRKYQLKLVFKVIEPKQPLIPGLPPPKMWCALDSIDPRRMPAARFSSDISRDSFFRLTIGSMDGTDYNIHEVAKFVANVLGGVHSGTPSDQKEKLLNELRDTYIFSNVNILLQHIQSIGRIILETLKPLRYKVLSLERFEDAPGISIHIAVALFPDEPEKELYILDIGTERDKNRLSIYLDTRHDLSFRMVDSTGHRTIVRAGPADCAYRYGAPDYFVFEAGILQDEIFLSVEAGGWSFSKTIQRRDLDVSHDRLFFVLGSDVNGVAETHMSVMEQCVYSRCLRRDERNQLRGYFENNIRRGYRANVYFKGNQFLHSAGHPNFPGQKPAR
jgi:hypothetical protein